MFGTYGIHSVNASTLNSRVGYKHPKEIRDQQVTVLRVHNLILNTLGYLGAIADRPKLRRFSGTLRMLTGFGLVAKAAFSKALLKGENKRFASYYNEILSLGLAQMTRGAIEAFAPYSGFINLYLDAYGTLQNPNNEFFASQQKITLLQDPAYPIACFPLKLV